MSCRKYFTVNFTGMFSSNRGFNNSESQLIYIAFD